MNPLDRLIVDAAFASLLRNRARLIVPVCSGRIHDSGASTVADINAMFTETEDGSHQHTPLIRGGQGRSDAELAEWGDTLCAVVRYMAMAGAVVVLVFVLKGVL